jgi:hypothetical protein
VVEAGLTLSAQIEVLADGALVSDADDGVHTAAIARDILVNDGLSVRRLFTLVELGEFVVSKDLLEDLT